MEDTKIPDLQSATEYELIENYKNGGNKTKVIEILYDRYIGLIESFAYKYQTTWNRKDSSVEFDDLVSNFSELLWRTIEYIDIEKINQKINGVFGIYLKTQIRYYNRDKIAKLNKYKNISLFDKINNSSPITVIDTLSDDKELLESKIRVERFNKTLSKFLDCCTERERIIFNSLREGKKDYEVQQDFGFKSISHMCYYKKKIRKKYISIFKREGFF